MLMCLERRAPSIRGGLGFGWVDFDAALEMGAVFDANPGGGNVAGDRAVTLDVDAIAGIEIADNFAVDDNFAGMNFGVEDGAGANGELMAIERDGALHVAVNLQVFRAGELPLDVKAGTQAS